MSSLLLFAAYAAGFFTSTSSFAFGSDHILDLIPCDTVAALVIAAAAAAVAEADSAGAAAPTAARVYHSASSESYPLTAAYAVNEMEPFWSANPPPLRLPVTK